MAVALRLEKGPAALLRCRIIFVWGPNSPLAALILWRETTKFVIARRPQADVAISQCPAASRESYQRNRNCLHEIATALSGPRNDKSGAIAVLSLACTNRQRCAGPGCPLPYNARQGTAGGLAELSADLFSAAAPHSPRACGP